MISITRRARNKDGTLQYTVEEGGKLIATFSHERRKGLPTCLRLAAAAVERAEYDRWAELFEDSPGDTGGL